jgi:hypothetical protein
VSKLRLALVGILSEFGGLPLGGGNGQVGLTGSQSGLRVLPIRPTSAPNTAYECSQYGLRVLPIRPTSAPNTAYECSQTGDWPSGEKHRELQKSLFAGPVFGFEVDFWSVFGHFWSILEVA